MQPGEQVIFQIKRHPIGIISIYAVLGVMLAALAVVIFGVGPGLFSDIDRNTYLGYGAIVFLLVTLLSVVFSFIANIVYWGNTWILTSDSVTQIAQTSLFNKHSSQLSLNNLEDVTVEQNGMLTHIFNYGILKAETAGERSKFSFVYCANPNFYAQKILQAREMFEQAGRYEAPHYQTGQAVPGSTQFTGSPDPVLPPQQPGQGQAPPTYNHDHDEPSGVNTGTNR